MQEITIDSKYTKTYKTKENLRKALSELNLPETLRYLLCEVEGRFTAVFVNTVAIEKGIYTYALAHKGFKVVG